MEVSTFSKFFTRALSFENLYHMISDSEHKQISYPSDAFDKTESENQGFWAQARLVAIKRAMNKNCTSQMVEVGAGGGAVCSSGEG